MHITDRRDHRRRLRVDPAAWWTAVGAAGIVAVLGAACSSTASSPTSTVLEQRATSSHTTRAVVSTASAGTLGTILVDRSGFTLYRFAPDGTGKTTCTGACAAAWPPLTVPNAPVTAGPGVTASELGTITRPEGTLQVTFDGMPLYRFSGDKKPGDTMGQGVAGEWSVVPATATPAPAAAPTTTTSAPPPPSTTPPTSPPSTGHTVSPQNTGTGAPAPAATAPPVTAPPVTAPPVTAPPVTPPPPPSAPPTTQGGGGYGY